MNLKLSSTIDYLRMLEGYAEGILDRDVSLAINTKGVLVATDGENMACVSINSFFGCTITQSLSANVN